MEIKEISIDKIRPDPNQPRKSFDEEALKHLAESILGNGLLNPIEVDSNYIITDGERRWRACKIAKLKTISCRVVGVKNDTEKLRRQLLFSMGEGINSDDKYRAFIELWKREKEAYKNPEEFKLTSIPSQEFCKSMGVSVRLLRSAFDYCEYANKEPEIAKKVSPSIIMQTAYLPDKERKEVLKEFEGTKDGNKPKTELIKELVQVKRREVQDKKIMKELEGKSKEIQKSKETEIRIQKTEESLSTLRDQIDKEVHNLGKIYFYVKSIRKTRLYVEKPRAKEQFFKYLDGVIDKVENWAKELKRLKDDIELEVIKE